MRKGEEEGKEWERERKQTTQTSWSFIHLSHTQEAKSLFSLTKVLSPHNKHSPCFVGFLSHFSFLSFSFTFSKQLPQIIVISPPSLTRVTVTILLLLLLWLLLLPPQQDNFEKSTSPEHFFREASERGIRLEWLIPYFLLEGLSFFSFQIIVCC